MLAVPALDFFPHPRRARARARLACLLVVSLILHGWVASDLSRVPAARFDLHPVLNVQFDVPAITVAMESRDVVRQAIDEVPASAPDRPRTSTREIKNAGIIQHAATYSEDEAIGVDVPDPAYYTVREVDVYPALLTPLDSLPWRASNETAAGVVLVQIRIDEAGRVTRVAIVETTAVRLSQTRLRAAMMAARFLPAHREGRPVKSEVAIRLRFDEDRGARTED